MIDVAFGSLLTVASVVVAWLNAIEWDESREARDMCATVTWAGCACYWAVVVAEGLAGMA